MKSRLVRLFAAALAVAGFLALSPRASAEFLSLELERTVPRTVTVNLGTSTISNVRAGPYYWSDTNEPTNANFPPPITTFCIELTDTVAKGDSYTFAVLSPQAAPTIGTSAKADDVRALFGNFYNPAWASNSFTGSKESTAFQLALWELIYETDTTKTLNSGHFGMDGTSEVKSHANQMLAGRSGGLTKYNAGGYEIVALVAPAPGNKDQTPAQDQITVRSVPAPPAVLLAGVGVLALVGRARWTRRPPLSA